MMTRKHDFLHSLFFLLFIKLCCNNLIIILSNKNTFQPQMMTSLRQSSSSPVYLQPAPGVYKEYFVSLIFRLHALLVSVFSREWKKDDFRVRCRVRTVGRAGGRAVGVWSRDYQMFSDGQFPTFSYPWCSAGALCAPELRYQNSSLLPVINTFKHGICKTIMRKRQRCSFFSYPSVLMTQ